MKQWSFDNLEVGEEFGYEYVLTPELVQYYLDAMEIQHPWYTEDSPFGGPIAPPAWVAQTQARAILSKYANQDGAVHAVEEVEFLNPARVGKRIRVEARLVDKYVKRGRQYIVREFRSIDEDGVEICREVRHNLVQYRPVES